MRFEEIPGHQALKETLIGSSRKNHIAHAQLFSGREGSASLALALAYITYLFCENKSENDSCGTCPSCHKMAGLVHPDVHLFFPGPGKGGENKEKIAKIIQDQTTAFREFITKGHPYQSIEDWSLLIDAENKKTQIGKDDARNIIKTVSMKSFEGSYKMILIWYPEMMNSTAANAILKVLEEPPEKTLYFLVSYHYEQLLTTILSRTQLIQVPEFSDQEIASHLISQKGMTESTAEKVASFASGNMRKALVEASESANIDHTPFAEWMRACFAQNQELLIKYAADFKTKSKSQQRVFLQYGISLIRQSVLAQAGSEMISIQSDAAEFAKKFAKTLDIESLSIIASELGKMIGHLDRNSHTQLTFMATSHRLSMAMNKPKQLQH